MDGIYPFVTTVSSHGVRTKFGSSQKTKKKQTKTEEN